MSKTKKIVILSCMILLLAVTAVANFLLSGTGSFEDDAVTAATYFTQYRTERSASRNEQLTQLNEVIASAAENTSERNDALEMKIKLTEIIEKELILENLIKARGYEEIVVSIGLSSENVNVVVKDADFNEDDAVAIYSILQAEAGATPDKVNIIPIS